MSDPFDRLRILLLQARSSPAMLLQEQGCFIERCRIRPDQLVSIDATRDQLRPSVLDGFDAFMIGGAGEYSATQAYAWTPAVHDLIREAYERRIPTFGACWGHQVIACAFGGEVIHDTERAEIGCGSVSLTAEGMADPLFGSFPRSFRVNMGHHDRVARLPGGAVELAFNDSQRNQALRMGDRPMYGTQFHTELDAERYRERLIAYRALYDEVASQEAYDAVIESLRTTTEADHLLHDFLRRFAVEEES